MLNTHDRLQELYSSNENSAVVTVNSLFDDSDTNMLSGLSKKINSIDANVKKLNKLIYEYTCNVDKPNYNKQINDLSREIEEELKLTKQQIQNAIHITTAINEEEAQLKQLQFKTI